MAQQNAGSNIPLPPGWEAKYSDQTKRYYFIDHVSKQTQWDDPRLSHPFLWGQQENVSLAQLKREFTNFPELVIRETLLKNTFNLQQARSELTAMAGGRKPPLQQQQSETGHATTTAAPKPETPGVLPAAQFALVSQRPTATQNAYRSEPLQPVNVVSKPPVKQTDAFDLMSVKSKFPEVPDTVIEEVLRQFGHDIDKTNKQLKSMGFKTRQAAVASVDRVALDKEEREKLLEKQRDETFKQIKLEFSSLPDAAIADVLKKHNYDAVEARSAMRQLETKARLEQMLTQSALNVSNFEREQAASAEKKKSQQEAPPDVSATPVTTNEANQRSVASSSNAITPAQSKSETPPLTNFLNNTIINVSRRENKTLNEKTATFAKGADPSLRRGPDKKLLTKDLPKACGPDPSLRCGPSKQYHSGPNVTLLNSSSFKA